MTTGTISTVSPMVFPAAARKRDQRKNLENPSMNIHQPSIVDRNVKLPTPDWKIYSTFSPCSMKNLGQEFPLHANCPTSMKLGINWSIVSKCARRDHLTLLHPLRVQLRTS